MFGDQHYGIPILEQSSVFTAEAWALLPVLKNIEKGQEQNFLIATDTKSCLQVLNSVKTDHPIIVNILSKVDFTEGKLQHPLLQGPRLHWSGWQ